MAQIPYSLLPHIWNIFTRDHKPVLFRPNWHAFVGTTPAQVTPRRTTSSSYDESMRDLEHFQVYVYQSLCSWASDISR
jgi:hypothetical protein